LSFYLDWTALITTVNHIFSVPSL